jgi:hypothetical protein
MIRKSHLAAALFVLATAMPAFAELTDAEVKKYANQLGNAFPGQVDVFLLGERFQSAQPSIQDVRLIGCSQVAGILYYVLRMPQGAEMFVPQSQILAIRNRVK